MTTNYPNSLDAFTLKTDGIDDVMAADINNLQDAIRAVQTLLGAPPLGYFSIAPSGTYVNATSFTIPGDFTAFLKIGTKIRLMNTTVKYGYVQSSSYAGGVTVVNLVANNNYSVANLAITNIDVSYGSPPDFPAWFNFTTIWTGTITNPVLGDGTLSSRFNINNGLLSFLGVLVMGSTTTLGSGNWYFSFPLPSAGTTRYYGVGYVRDAGIANYLFTTQITGGDLEFRYWIDMTPGANNSFINPTFPIAWGAGDNVAWQIQYGIL